MEAADVIDVVWGSGRRWLGAARDHFVVSERQWVAALLECGPV